MPQDRSLLLVSMAFQGAVALTFGLAFLGLWKGFHRPMAIRWAVAWLVYAVGVVGTVLSLGLGVGSGLSLFGRALLPLPIQFGVLLFRAGTDSVVAPDRLKLRRYAAAALGLFAVVLAFRGLEAAGLVHLNPAVDVFILPRLLMGCSYAWAFWPLRTLIHRRWAEGVGLMAAALAGLSLRMFVTAGYEVAQMARGAGDRPESPLLTIAQICLLIVFGVATALVLVEAERLEALRAAQTLRETAAALSASEARFRFVVEHTSDVQVIVDADSRIRYIAPNCERLLGLPPSAFDGRTWLDLIHPDDRGTVTSALTRMHADPGARRPPIPVLLQHQSGGWLPFDVSGELVMQDGGPTLVLSLRDMAAQRHLEAMLAQTRRLDSLGRMAGNVAHDFNNTLMAITGGLELALEQLPPDSPAARPLDIVRNAAARGEALTRHLLTFARQLPATSERFDVRDRLAALDEVVGLAVGRVVRVVIPPSADVLSVRTDPDQFDQVILNLAINARDAMPHGGQLTIQAGVVSEDARAPLAEPPISTSCVRIVVEDTGVGIPAAVVHRIFDPFFTTKTDGRGTGLGLASAYGFARQAGGRLSVESTEGVGTRFSLDLPLDVIGTAGRV